MRAGQDSGGRVRVETNPPLGVLPLLPGELVYAPGPTAAKPGVLYMVWDTFDPSTDGLPGTGDLVVKVVELVRWPKGKRLGGHTYSLSLMPVSDAYGERPFQSLAPGEVPWEVDAYLLWTAGSWADELPKGTVEKSTKWRPAQRLARSPLGQAWLRAFSFDPRAADIELARTGRKLIEDEGRQPTEPRKASQVVVESDSRRQVHTSDMEPAKPARTAATRSAVAFGKATLEAPRADPDRPRAGQAPEAGLAPRKEPHQSTRIAPEGSADVENIGELLGEMAIKGDDDLRYQVAAEDEQVTAQLEEAAGAANEAIRIAESRESGKHAQRRSTEAGRETTTRRAPQICRSRSVTCKGCLEPIELGATMVPVGTGMSHDNTACTDLARAHAMEETQKAKEQRARKEVSLPSAKHEAQLAHKFSDDRLDLALACLGGACREEAERIFCAMGCGRGLHLRACGGLADRRTRVSRLVCIECRIAKMAPHSACAPASLTLRRQACRNMLVELASGAESTAASLCDFERLEREWLLYAARDLEGGAAELIEPRYNEESFLSFVNWLPCEGGRARSFETVIRSAGIALAKQCLTNWTTKPSVKAAIKEIRTLIGSEPDPCALPSRRIIRIAINTTLPRRCKGNPRLLTRAVGLLCLELGCGFRVGEATGAGEGHGVAANHSFILSPHGGGEDQFVGMRIEDSKTFYGRTAGMVAVTEGPLRLRIAEAIRALWADSGLSVKEETYDGMRCLRPDYWVMRLSLLGLTSDGVDRVAEWMESTAPPSARPQVRSVVNRVRELQKSKNASEETLCVNVTGGARQGPEQR